ncbi:MAG: acyltransferase [Nitrospinota bacterium]|nr:acyltransferase [Nitrospinota bacterium]
MTDNNQNIDIQIQKESGSSGKSKLIQYQDLVVGSRSLWFLIKFELIGLLFSRIPGSLGLVLRKMFYPMILGQVGHGVVFGMDVWFRHPKKIRIGAGTIIDDGALLDAKGSANEGITMGKSCYIGRGSVLSCKEGDILFGDFVNLSTWCNISSNSSIAIGDKTLLGPFTSLFATTHNFDDPEIAVLDQGWTSKGIKIGSNCWLGARVSVLDGVTIGDDTVVGTAALVTADLPDRVVAVGSPARVARERKPGDAKGSGQGGQSSDS